MLLPIKIHKTHPISGENRKKAEEFLEEASAHHIYAENYLKEGNYKEAAENAILAQMYLDLASETVRMKTVFKVS
jgi:hypothetical protein